MGDTRIEWAEKVWNPVTGCSKISPGCNHCYAERMAKRLAGRCGYDKENPFRITFHENKIRDPYRWVKPRRVFVNSMGDLFHDDVPFEWLDRLMKVIWDNRKHTFIFLTKRPGRMLQYFSEVATPGVSSPASIRLLATRNYANDHSGWHMRYLRKGYLPNLVLGVTAEDQEQADERIPILLQVPAVVRFVSIEPMLNRVSFGKIPVEDSMPELDWVVVGGETGPGAREMNVYWLYDIIDQCRQADVPLFIKQISGRNHNCRHYYVTKSTIIRMFPGDTWK